MNRSYFLNLCVALDQFVAAIFGIDCDLTISGWLGYYRPESWLRKVIDWVFLKLDGEINHCYRSIEWDIIARIQRSKL
jgi:hypothetical protein